MPSSKLVKVGDKVTTNVRIWDDGADHHPPVLLAACGDELIIREVHDGVVEVSHEHITNATFTIYYDEFELTT